MAMRNEINAPVVLVEKYLNTAYDTVKFVADNIGDVVELFDNLGGNQAKFKDGTVDEPGITFANDLNSGFYKIADNNIGITINGIKIVDIAETAVSILSTVIPSNKTLVTTTDTQTLTGKTLTNPAFSGVTANMGTVTTIDINGGTIDGTSIGVSSKSQGNFTSLTSTASVVFGSQATDTMEVSGCIRTGGSSPALSTALRLGNTLTGATSGYGLYSKPLSDSGVTSSLYGVASSPQTQDGVYTLNNSYGYFAYDVTKGAGATITYQYGIYVSDQTQGVNNYGITCNVSAGSSKWNLFSGGTAPNHFNGNVCIGTTSTTSAVTDIRGTQNDSVSILNIVQQGTGRAIQVARNVPAATRPTVSIGQTSASGGSQPAMLLQQAATGEVALGINTDGSSSTFNLSITDTGTVKSKDSILGIGTGGLGYGTGSGGTVTQITSRTTDVTLNKTNGAITLVSAAGSASWQSFNVNNSTVSATDTVIVSQKSGTNLYMIFVTAVSAGSFKISFATTGGVVVEQPVFNFAVIKAVTA